MGTKPQDDDFTPQEAQERFEAVLRAALKTPPQHRSSKKGAAPKKPRGPYRRASGASAKTGQRAAGKLAQ